MVVTRTKVLPVRAEGIPEELKIRPQWVVWRPEERDDEPTKVPYTICLSKLGPCDEILCHHRPHRRLSVTY
jgi:hypothetical protein